MIAMFKAEDWAGVSALFDAVLPLATPSMQLRVSNYDRTAVGALTVLLHVSRSTVAAVGWYFSRSTAVC